MANFPAAGHISDGDRTKAEVKADLEATIAAAKQSLGGISESAPVIASGVITPEVPILKVRTESAAATDNLDNIAVTNFHGGAMIVISAYSASEVVTIRNAQGGSGQIKTADGSSIVLDDVATHVLLALNGTDWEEKGRFSPRLPFAHTATKTGAYTVTLTDRGTVFLCTAASGWALGLPAPATAGAGFMIAVKKTDNNANAITLTPASGNIEGASTYALDALNEYAIVVCDGSAYYVISEKPSAVTQCLLQRVTSTCSSQSINATVTPSATGLSGSITIKNASSKLLVRVSDAVYHKGQCLTTTGLGLYDLQMAIPSSYSKVMTRPFGGRDQSGGSSNYNYSSMPMEFEYPYTHGQSVGTVINFRTMISVSSTDGDPTVYACHSDNLAVMTIEEYL